MLLLLKIFLNYNKFSGGDRPYGYVYIALALAVSVILLILLGVLLLGWGRLAPASRWKLVFAIII
jgi:hypothetical protein